MGDVRDVALGQDPGAMMYVPYAQSPFWGANVVVKSTLGTSSVAAAIRRNVQQIDKDLPVTDVAMMKAPIDALPLRSPDFVRSCWACLPRWR